MQKNRNQEVRNEFCISSVSHVDDTVSSLTGSGCRGVAPICR
jgi:hypothetical protein